MPDNNEKTDSNNESKVSETKKTTTETKETTSTTPTSPASIDGDESDLKAPKSEPPKPASKPAPTKREDKEEGPPARPTSQAQKQGEPDRHGRREPLSPGDDPEAVRPERGKRNKGKSTWGNLAPKMPLVLAVLVIGIVAYFVYTTFFSSKESSDEGSMAVAVGNVQGDIKKLSKDLSEIRDFLNNGLKDEIRLTTESHFFDSKVKNSDGTDDIKLGALTQYLNQRDEVLFNQIDSKFNGIEESFNEKLLGIDESFGQIDRRIYSLEEKSDKNRSDIIQVDNNARINVAELEERISARLDRAGGLFQSKSSAPVQSSTQLPPAGSTGRFVTISTDDKPVPINLTQLYPSYVRVYKRGWLKDKYVKIDLVIKTVQTGLYYSDLSELANSIIRDIASKKLAGKDHSSSTAQAEFFEDASASFTKIAKEMGMEGKVRLLYNSEGRFTRFISTEEPPMGFQRIPQVE